MSAPQFGEWSAKDPGFVPSILATVIFKCLVQGTLLAAGYRYFSIVHTTKDKIRMRVFVVVIISLDALHTGVSIAKLYLIMIKGCFLGAHWLNASDSTLTGVICFMAQLFFAYRCWRITKGSTFTLYILLLSTLSVFIGAIGMIVVVWLAYSHVLPSTSISVALVSLWGLSSAIFELLVSVLLIKFLWASRTGIEGLDKVVLKLFIICVESSLPCLIFVLIFSVTVLAKNVAANFFAYSTASLYGLSVMVSLNCREKIHNDLSEYRREGALVNFAGGQTSATAESQMFSEEGLVTRRVSRATTNVVADQYRRPSILSLVKEAMPSSPRPQTLEE